MGGKRLRRCSLKFSCPELSKHKDYICCADCKTKENCRFACQNQPEKCGLLEKRKGGKK